MMYQLNEIIRPQGVVVVVPLVRCECTCHGQRDHCEWCCGNDTDGYCPECLRGES